VELDVPLHIAFHNLQPSRALESYIRRRVSKLQTMYSRLIGCRVSVEAPHNQHRTGNICQVHIEMHVPQGDLVVSHEPNRVKERYAKRDVHMSVRYAFKTAEQQLKEYKDRQGEEEKIQAPQADPFRLIEQDTDEGTVADNKSAWSRPSR
jgi:ribosome-associated translation inhibitor RaiA